MRIIPLRRRQEGASEGWPQLMRDRMDRLFQNFFETGYPELRGAWWPDVDILESERGFEIRAELPGMSAEEIRIDVQGGALTISGEKRSEREEEKESCHCAEIQYGSFQRTLELPDTADLDRIDAQYDKGVLRLQVPRKEGAKPKRIAVKGVAEGGDGGPKPKA